MTENERYPDVMVDIETTGTRPDRNAILQIAAVKFNLETREVSPDFFNQCMTVPKWRSWDQGCVEWWSQQPDVLRNIMAQSQDPKTVMTSFQKYIVDAGQPRMWSKPSHFDFVFISGYFEDYDMVNPLSYRDAIDMNSFIRGMYIPELTDTSKFEKTITHEGAAHDGLQDCFFQLKTLFAHLDNLNTTE